jgi:hypothetical protein
MAVRQKFNVEFAGTQCFTFCRKISVAKVVTLILLDLIRQIFRTSYTVAPHKFTGHHADVTHGWKLKDSYMRRHLGAYAYNSFHGSWSSSLEFLVGILFHGHDTASLCSF